MLDIDYHHGNGTSKVFYDDPTVLYVSLHGSPDYPCESRALQIDLLLTSRPCADFTGAETERGAGAGLGMNLNFPLPLGTDDDGYLSTLREAVEQIRSFEADFLIVS